MTGLVAAAVVLFCNFGNIMGADPLVSKYGQLVFSTLLYRHGDRSIENTYPNDPYKNSSYWPMGFGQLTPTGIERHFNLGKWLRVRFSGWLPEVFSDKDVYVQSSDYDRTIMSAQANLAGMYPPVKNGDWNEIPENHIQLFPVHTVPKPQDNLIAVAADCPLHSLELEELIENDMEVQNFFKQYSSELEYIQKNTGLEIESTSDAIGASVILYNSLTIESTFNYTLPKWTKKIFPEPLTTLATKVFGLSTYTTNMKKLKAGPLLNDIVTHMNEKKNGTLNPNRVLWIYSGHDLTLSNILNSMELYESTIPFAALLMIELRLNTTGNYVVTVSYRNTSDHEPYLLHVPGCDSVACNLEQFNDVLRPVISVDWNSDCKIIVENNFLELLIYLVGIIIAAIVIMLISYVIVDKIMFCCRRQSDYQTF